MGKENSRESKMKLYSKKLNTEVGSAFLDVTTLPQTEVSNTRNKPFKKKSGACKDLCSSKENFTDKSERQRQQNLYSIKMKTNIEQIEF